VNVSQLRLRSEKFDDDDDDGGGDGDDDNNETSSSTEGQQWLLAACMNKCGPRSEMQEHDAPQNHMTNSSVRTCTLHCKYQDLYHFSANISVWH